MAQALTLQVPDAVADILRIKATLLGEKMEIVAGEMLIERLETETARFDPAIISAIREGIADGEAGREESFETYQAEMQAKRLARFRSGSYV